ncbi:uncharacterized protein K489DRAFT_64999 [Dissoconium aciculare CBS 342.82]|uniref:Uncharacterized protein n=1 Tax=Dissoconium aciculare CBS 342.82 TaxID=1314786 RepID=A0A6J3LXL2_9PEZI|nr:uncharacterized protein K489DRAFT_64999 [Dissoconium aciculare CBS 342.82]KAF1819377.1 hypothetical protein K489DRAFT_64999 [Dissoconium aciculare CBS 342.82]
MMVDRNTSCMGYGTVNVGGMPRMLMPVSLLAVSASNPSARGGGSQGREQPIRKGANLAKREWGRRVRHTQPDASVGSAARLRWAPRACSLRPLLHALGGPHFWGHDHDPFRWLEPRSSREAADYGRPWGVVCGTAVLTSGSSTACLVRLRARGGGNWEEGRGLGREFAPVMH